MKSIFVSLLALFALVAFAPATATAQANDKNVVELAVGTPDLSTLVTAVQAAGLAETLSGDGPFTVFAPTNAAFANLPAGVLDALVMPENKATLVKILQYHVTDGKAMAADIMRGIENADDGMFAATTMNGPFTAMMKGDGVAIKSAAGNVANVIATDVAASNGVVHLIDAVLLPAGINVPALIKSSAKGKMNQMKDDMTDNMTKSTNNVVGLAVGTPDLSTLVTAVKAAGLAETLSGDGPFTVFAPTNAAFENLPNGVLNALLKPENKPTLVKILQYHVADGNVMASDIVNGIKGKNDGMYTASTMGGNFTTMMKGNGVAIKSAAGNVANVVKTDIKGSNGTVHVIDAVLLPAGIDVPALLGSSTQRSMNAGANARMSTPSMDLSANSYARAEGNTIVDVAAGNENFKTLTAAVKAAGLDGVLASTGEFTVFAPTEDAFGALPEGTVADLTRNENKAKLQGILQYHVIPARISAEKLLAAIKMGRGYARLQTIDGQSLYASTKNGDVMLTDGNGNTAKVIMTDVDSSNGVVHAIDGVLMPKTM